MADDEPTAPSGNEPPPSAPWTAPAPGATAPPPPAGVPAGAGPTGAGPVRRPSKAWVFILVGVLVLIVATVVAGTVLFVNRSLGPLDGANNFLHDVGSLRLASAANRLCAPDRANADAEIATVRAHFRDGKSFTVNPFSVDRTDDRATVDYAVQPRGGGASHSFTIPLRLENGHWHACPGDA
jgi:hypothetical protein